MKQSFPAVCFLLLFVFINACHSTRKITSNTYVPMNYFDVQGHRGCRGLMPENTVPAMIKALDLGVTTLEMDVVITKDNKVILSHDPYFSHEITTKPDGSFVTRQEEKELNIFEMNYEQVKRYDVGLKNNPRFAQQEKIAAYKPLLADVFQAVMEYMKTRRRPLPEFNIETKTNPATDNIYHPAPDVFVDLLMDQILQNGVQDRVTIQSFDIRTLQYLHQKYPGIKTALLVSLGNQFSFRKQISDLGFTPAIYSPDFRLVTAHLVTTCHDQNIRIIPWTVNDKKEMDRLRSLGVDGFITDYPNLLGS